MVRGEPSCSSNGKLPKRSIRLLAALLVGMVALAGGQMAWAHQSPAACTGNLLNVGLLKDKTAINNGDTVTFTVTIENDAPGACDVTGTNITFHCPAADGTPTGAATVCATNADYFVPFAPINLCQVACTVTFNPGVTSAQALVDGAGKLHDNPDNDFDSADIHRTLSVIVHSCGDGTVNQTCETCDGADFTNPPAVHGACRTGTGNSCPLANDACTYCGDSVLQPGSGETCDQATFPA